MAIFDKITVKLIFWQEDWVFHFLSPKSSNFLRSYITTLKVSNSWRQLCYSCVLCFVIIWLVIVAFSQVCNFSHIFCTWLSEEFGFWNFWVFKALYLLQMIVLPQQNTPCVQILALFLAWVDLNSCFLHNSSQFNSCFRKMKILAISHQFSAVNFEKNCQRLNSFENGIKLLINGYFLYSMNWFQVYCGKSPFYKLRHCGF